MGGITIDFAGFRDCSFEYELSTVTDCCTGMDVGTICGIEKEVRRKRGG